MSDSENEQSPELPQRKIDKRSIASKLNAKKAREAKLAKLAAKNKQKSLTTVQELEYTDSSSEDDSDSDSDLSEIMIIKPTKKQSSYRGKRKEKSSSTLRLDSL